MRSSWDRRVLGRQGQGHHRAQPDRPETRGRAGPGTTPVSIRLHRDARSARHLHPCGRRHRTRRPRRDLRRLRPGPRVHRPGIGQVQHRPPEGCCRCRGRVQGRDEPERQGAPPELAFPGPQPERGLGRDPVPCEHRAARVDPLRSGTAARRGERVRLRRDQLPRRARGVPARPSQGARRRTRVRRRRHPGHVGAPAAPRPHRHRCDSRRPRRPPCAAPPWSVGATRPMSSHSSGAVRRGAQPAAPPPGSPGPALAPQPIRVAIDYADAADLAKKARQGRAGIRRRQPGDVEAAAPQGVFVGRGPAARSRSCSPGRARSTSTCSPSCAARSRSCATVYDEADRIMTPLLGQAAVEYVFVDAEGPRGGRAPRRPAAADRDHPARGADHRRRPDQLLAGYGITPTWSWATASASTAHWWRRVR